MPAKKPPYRVHKARKLVAADVVAGLRDVGDLEVRHECLQHRRAFVGNDRATLGVSRDQQRRAGDLLQGDGSVDTRRIVSTEDTEDVRTEAQFGIRPGFQFGD
jgi:hypothetical protein